MPHRCRIPAGCTGARVTGLCAPYWDQYARGMIIGLTRGSGREQICRSALESIAYQARDCLVAMEKDSRLKPVSLRVDGGATKSDFLMQFQADILVSRLNGRRSRKWPRAAPPTSPVLAPGLLAGRGGAGEAVEAGQALRACDQRAQARDPVRRRAGSGETLPASGNTRKTGA